MVCDFPSSLFRDAGNELAGADDRKGLGVVAALEIERLVSVCLVMVRVLESH
jgi:hypothetical protein